MYLSFAVFFLYIIISIYVFRFQRTTLSIARALNESDVPSLQLILTPSWMGLLGWVSTGLLILTVVLFFIFGNWLWSIGVLLWAFFGLAIADSVTPLPSYKYCFKVIEKHLKTEINKTNDELAKKLLTEYLVKVNEVAKKYSRKCVRSVLTLRRMKRRKITIHSLLKKLAMQSGEEKLRIAFKLSSFVNKIKSAGEGYEKNQYRPRTTP